VERLFLERLLFLLWFLGRREGGRAKGSTATKAKRKKMSPSVAVVAVVVMIVVVVVVVVVAWAMLNKQQKLPFPVLLMK